MEKQALDDYLFAYPGVVDLNVIATYWAMTRDSVVKAIRALGMIPSPWKMPTDDETAARLRILIEKAVWPSQEVVHLHILAHDRKLSAEDLRDRFFPDREIADVEHHLTLNLPLPCVTKHGARPKHRGIKGSGLELLDRKALNEEIRSYPGSVTNSALADFFSITLGTVQKAIEKAGYDRDSWKAEQEENRKREFERVLIRIPKCSIPVSRFLHLHLLHQEGTALKGLQNDPFLREIPPTVLEEHLSIPLPSMRDVLMKVISIEARRALHDYLRECTGGAPLAAIGRFWKIKSETVARCIAEAGLTREEWQSSIRRDVA